LKKILAVLIILLFHDPLLGQNAKDNVLHALKQFNLQDTIVVVSVGADHIEAVPALKDGMDRLGTDFRENKKRWRRNWGICTRLEHHGGIQGWRARKKFSLHVTAFRRTADGSLYYEIHVDHWAPSLWNPLGSFFHCFGEYVPHKLTGGHTSLAAVARGLAKEDAHIQH
jgi:hypothetical protein